MVGTSPQTTTHLPCLSTISTSIDHHRAPSGPSGSCILRHLPPSVALSAFGWTSWPCTPLPRPNSDASSPIKGKEKLGPGLRSVTLLLRPAIPAGAQALPVVPGVPSGHRVPRNLFRYNFVPVTCDASSAPLRACLCHSTPVPEPPTPSLPVPLHPRFQPSRAGTI